MTFESPAGIAATSSQRALYDGTFDPGGEPSTTDYRQDDAAHGPSTRWIPTPDRAPQDRCSVSAVASSSQTMVPGHRHGARTDRYSPKCSRGARRTARCRGGSTRRAGPRTQMPVRGAATAGASSSRPGRLDEGGPLNAIWSPRPQRYTRGHARRTAKRARRLPMDHGRSPPGAPPSGIRRQGGPDRAVTGHSWPATAAEGSQPGQLPPGYLPCPPSGAPRPGTPRPGSRRRAGSSHSTPEYLRRRLDHRPPTRRQDSPSRPDPEPEQQPGDQDSALRRTRDVRHRRFALPVRPDRGKHSSPWPEPQPGRGAGAATTDLVGCAGAVCPLPRSAGKRKEEP